MKILDKLEEKRVVSFGLNEAGTKMVVGECCDHYFGIALSKKEFNQLIEELTELYKEMPEIEVELMQ